jgi:hypothetical protein
MSKLHCGDPERCEKDPYAEDRCDCSCERCDAPRAAPPAPDQLAPEEQRVAAHVDGYLRGESNARPLSDAGVAVAGPAR